MSAPRIPVTIVTGFLGAGKTTLLSHLVGAAKQRRLAILVNEFGEVSIDGAILRNHETPGHVEIHDASTGLVAYSEDEDFLPIMQAILDRRHLFDHMLIETSGLALPTAVMERLQGNDLKDHFVLDAVLAIVDTPLLLAGGFGASEHADSGLGHAANQSVARLFEQQLVKADIVVLNKIDTLVEDDLMAAESQVRALAPGVRFLELAYGARLDTRLTLGLHLHEATPAAHGTHYSPVQGMPGTPLSHAQLDGHVHGGLGSHFHGLSTHRHFHEQDPGWQSFVARSREPQDEETLQQAVVAIAQAEPMLRVKGFATNATGSRFLVQGVRTRIDRQPQPEGIATGTAQLVFIGYHPSRSNTMRLLNELTGTGWH